MCIRDSRKIAERCAELGVGIGVSTDAHIGMAIGKLDHARKMLDEIHFPLDLIVTRDREMCIRDRPPSPAYRQRPWQGRGQSPCTRRHRPQSRTEDRTYQSPPRASWTPQRPSRPWLQQNQMCIRDRNVYWAAERGLQVLGSADHLSSMVTACPNDLRSYQFFINQDIWPRIWSGVLVRCV